jgi:hypothetical protein
LISSRPIQRRRPRTSAGRARRASHFYHVLKYGFLVKMSLSASLHSLAYMA